MSAFTSLQVDAPLSYLIAVVLPALDAIFPVLPSETAVIALGVAGLPAARRDLLIGRGQWPGPHTCLGTLPANMSRIILCPKSAVGLNISGQPPSITVIPRCRP